MQRFYQSLKLFKITALISAAAVWTGIAFSVAFAQDRLDFNLNDHTRFRINENGEIHQVQGFNFQIGDRYNVAYTPTNDDPELEIFTWIK